MDCVEDAIYLTTQIPNILCVHLRATRAGFAPENFVIVAGIDELKSSFCAIISLFSVC